MEIESMRDVCKTKRELALIDLLISTGIRVSEVSNIMLNDIDWEQRTIIIHGKGDKDRIVPILIRCKKHLKEYISNRGYNLSPYLFCGSKKPHNKMCTCSINNLLKTIGSRVGLSNSSLF